MRELAQHGPDIRACPRIGKDGSLPTVMLGGDGRHDVLFSGKVPVDGASAQTRLGDHVLHRRAMKALPCEACIGGSMICLRRDSR